MLKHFLTDHEHSDEAGFAFLSQVAVGDDAVVGAQSRPVGEGRERLMNGLRLGVRRHLLRHRLHIGRRVGLLLLIVPVVGRRFRAVHVAPGGFFAVDQGTCETTQSSRVCFEMPLLRSSPHRRAIHHLSTSQYLSYGVVLFLDTRAFLSNGVSFRNEVFYCCSNERFFFLRTHQR